MLALYIHTMITDYTESGTYLLDKEEAALIRRIEKALEEATACAALSIRYFSRKE